MARIRTIKPEFFTDGAIVECSTNARLLFIGSWVFADDFGNLDRSPKQIKAQIFPADNLDCEPLIGELLTQGLLVEYSANDKKFLHIQNFRKHQRIDRPGEPRCPVYEQSTSIPGTFVEQSTSIPGTFAPEGKGREVNIMSGTPDPTPINGKANQTLQADACSILTYLNEKAGRAYKPVDANIKLILARLKEGAAVDELRAVVDRKCIQWLGDEKMAQYLRPATLFNATKFAQYAGEAESSGRPEWMRDAI